MKKLLGFIVVSASIFGFTACTNNVAQGEDSCTLYQLADTTAKQCIYTSRESAEVLTSERRLGIRCRLSLCAEESDTVTLHRGEDSSLVEFK